MSSSKWVFGGNAACFPALPELENFSVGVGCYRRMRHAGWFESALKNGTARETAPARARWAMATHRNSIMSVKSTIEQAGKTMLGALTPGLEGSSDILDTLQTEHDDVQDLLERLTESDNARDQKSLVAQIKKALVPHTKAEEKVVYDAVLALKGKEAKIEGNEGYIEHGLASQTLKKLDTLTANSPEFKAAAKVLKELVEHHVREEESDIWAQVKENFSDEQRERMNRDFLAAKKKVKVS
jgi:hemerythrin superfamily protein